MTETHDDVVAAEFGAQQSWGADFADAWKLETGVDDLRSRFLARQQGVDPNYDPTTDIKGYEGYWQDFAGAYNKAEVDAIKQSIDLNNARRARLENSDRWFPQLAATALTPETVASLAVPAGWGSTALRSLGKSATLIAGSEAGFELVRQAGDPTRTNEEAMFTIGGAAVLGGLFSAAGSKVARTIAGRQEEKAIQLLLQTEASDMSGQPGKFMFGESENIMQRVRSSGYDGDMNVMMDPDAPSAASFRQTDQIQNHILRIYDELKGMNALVETDALFKATSPEEFFAEFGARIKRGESPEQIFNLTDEARANPRLMEAVRKADKQLSFRMMRRKEDPFAPDIRINPSMLRQKWKDYEANGKNLTYKPGFVEAGGKTLDDLGVPKFETEQDMLEFIMRHEMWHQATQADFPATKTFDRERFIAAENAANEGAAADYLNWRDANSKLGAVAYKSMVMRAIDGQLGHGLSKMQKSIADSLQTRLMNSPYTSVFRRSKTNMVKDAAHLLVGDGIFNTVANMAGRNVGSSVQVATKQWKGRAALLQEQLKDHWDVYRQKPPGRFMYVHIGSAVKHAEFNEFQQEVAKTLINGGKHENPAINAAVGDLRSFYDWARVQARQGGLLRMQSPEDIAAALRQLDDDLEGLPREAVDERKRLMARRQQLEAEHQYAKGMENGDFDDYYTRYYNTAAVRENRDAFEQMVYQSYLKEPYVYIPGKGWVETNSSTAMQRAKETVRRILQEENQLVKMATLPGELRQRKVPIPNRDLIDVDLGNGKRVDFIRTDVTSTAMQYAQSTGSQVEFAKRFRSDKLYDTPDEGFDAYVRAAVDAEIKAGTDKKTAGKIERDLRYMAAAVTHRVHTNPNRWDAQLARGIKNATHLSTMLLTGFTALNEAANLHARYGFRNVMRNASRQFDTQFNAYKQSNMKFLTRAGAILDVIEGSANVRFGEDAIDPAMVHPLLRGMEKATSAMFVANFMAPITVKYKMMSGMMSSDMMLSTLARRAGIAGRKMDAAQVRQEEEFFDSLALSPAIQKRITEQIRQHRESMYDPDTQLWHPNVDEWTDEGAQRQFEAAVLNEIESNILMATTSNKWKVMDGVVHIPDTAITRRFLSSKKVPKDGNYFRVENPMISLPFMYMSWTLAATGKVSGRMVRNEYAAPLGFMMSAVAMSWFANEIRTEVKGSKEDFITFDQKLSAALWRSNINNIIGEYAERSMFAATSAAQAHGLSEFDIRPKYLQWLDVQSTEKELLDQAAGVGLTKFMDAGIAGYNLATGNPAELRDITNILPLQQMPLYSDLLRAVREMGEE